MLADQHYSCGCLCVKFARKLTDAKEFNLLAMIPQGAAVFSLGVAGLLSVELAFFASSKRLEAVAMVPPLCNVGRIRARVVRGASGGPSGGERKAGEAQVESNLLSGVLRWK